MRRTMPTRVIVEGLLPDVPVVVHTNAWLPRLLRVKGITLGRHIFVRVPLPWLDTMLLAHEVCHVEQWRTLGVCRFLWQYLSGLVAFGYGLAHPMEREAYDYALAHADRVAPILNGVLARAIAGSDA